MSHQLIDNSAPEGAGPVTSRLFASGLVAIAAQSSSLSMNLPQRPSLAPIICPLPVLSARLPTPQPRTPDCVLSWTFPPLREFLHAKRPPSCCPHLPHSLSLLRPSLGALPQKKSPQGFQCVPSHQVVSPPLGPHRTTLVSAGHLELFTAWAYLFQSRGQLLQERAGFDSSLSLCLQGPQSCRKQALPSAGWKGASFSSLPLHHFYLKEYPSHVQSI